MLNIVVHVNILSLSDCTLILMILNSVGLNGLNFLMPAGHAQGGVPAVAMPYFLVHSPLIAGTMPSSGAEGLSFSVPTVLSPARFVMAGGAFGVVETLNSPEDHGHRLPAATFSPQGPRAKESPQPAQTQVSLLHTVLCFYHALK